MPNITLAISEELKEKMDSFPEINWSKMTRKMISDKLDNMEELNKLNDLLKNSKLTEKDISEMIRKSKKN